MQGNPRFCRLNTGETPVLRIGDSQNRAGRPVISDMSRGFSVIIAAHNEEAVIEATLRSVLNNKLDRPLQVIVVEEF